VLETEDDQRLRERLEAARRRVAAARAIGEYGPVGQDQAPDRARSHRKAISGLTLIEILKQGRERARAQAEEPRRAVDGIAYRSCHVSEDASKSSKRSSATAVASGLTRKSGWVTGNRGYTESWLERSRANQAASHLRSGMPSL
jgi:hypothetical protein